MIPEWNNIRSTIKDAGHAGAIPERNIRSRRCSLSSGITTFWSGYSALGSPLQLNVPYSGADIPLWDYFWSGYSAPGSPLQTQHPIFWSGYSAPGPLRAKNTQTPDQQNLDPGSHENLDLGSRKPASKGCSCLSATIFPILRPRSHSQKSARNLSPCDAHPRRTSASS